MSNQREPTDLLHAVRAAFVAQKTSFSAWCAQEGIARPYAARALRGMEKGPAGIALRKRILTAVKIHDAA